MLKSRRIPLFVLGLLLVAGLSAGAVLAVAADDPAAPPAAALAPAQPHSPLQTQHYVLLGWNDLGMHCYNRDFQNLAVLPPYNTLWAQLILAGDPPQIVTSTVTIEYSFPDNTYSVNAASVGKAGWPDKSNFWQHAQNLFGLQAPLSQANGGIGLTGRAVSGTMDRKAGHFEAIGIPLTEYSDSEVQKNPANPVLWQRQPYQLARLVAKDASGNVLATQDVVAPVSTEMRCDNCHSDGQREGIATGKVETNILTFHDQEEGTNLMGTQPVLCASCHSSNALGAPGVPGVKSLSNAMHQKHAEEANIPATTAGCYNCHPGPSTQCLRDAMTLKHGFSCESCHGDLARVGQNTNPWLNEPRCDNGGCHDPGLYGIGGTQVGIQTVYLYRMTAGTTVAGNFTGHDGIYCEGCHDSTHAIAQSREPNDAIKFINLQGHAGTLSACGVCHTGTARTGTIHPLQSIILPRQFYLPLLSR